MNTLRSIGQAMLGFVTLGLVVWVLFGRGQDRRDERDEASLKTLLHGQELHEGDLIFNTSQSDQSRAIQLATHSPYSHCGILYQKAGHWKVFEAAQVVKLTSLSSWIDRGKNGHFAIKRLHDAGTALTPAALLRLKAAGQPLLGQNYDKVFGWSDDEMYCSELVWKVYARGLNRRIGRLQQLRDFDLSAPAVQAKLRERYGNRLPLADTVISPVSIFNSPELVAVLRR